MGRLQYEVVEEKTPFFFLFFFPFSLSVSSSQTQLKHEYYSLLEKRSCASSVAFTERIYKGRSNISTE